ncbi:MAG: hypothetical protein F9K24_20680 [Leptonema illini]|uniref:Uncharacterized protein n=1 Tax=Leptonema illini TaxID=183 RepID=A0A833GXQ6_9LEPT|nr:MAG: hypothetical protein F9K24_20680 [Leptonema illini]
MIIITPADAVFAETLLNRKALWVRSKGIWKVYVPGFGFIVSGSSITETAIAARNRLHYLLGLKKPKRRYRLFSGHTIRHKEAGR